MNILAADKLSKRYSEKILFDEISFSINDGDRIGLIGINGTGKSTLLKVIAGIEPCDTGNILKVNGVVIEYLPQNPEFADGTTILEQVFKGTSPVMVLLREFEKAMLQFNENLGVAQYEKNLLLLTQKMDNLKAWTIEAEAKSILTKLGVADFQTDVSKLSGGERKRVAIAAALIHPADLLILDEPTNQIDHDTVDWLENHLSKRKGALLMVTHDRYFLDRLANRILELDYGSLFSYKANYSTFLEMKTQREDLAIASERKRQSLIRKELEWIQRGAKARSTKQKARIDRYEKLTSQKGINNQDTVEMQSGVSRLGKKIIHLQNIQKSFPSGTVVADFSYNLLRDDRIGIIGANGSGKSTLIKIAGGKLDADSGLVEMGDTVRIGFFSQENEALDENLRVIEYIREQADYVTTADGEITASQMLERFLFPPNMQWAQIATLSGGEKRRLILLRILMSSPNVLMLDEPTNDLDIQTLNVLENYLDDFAGAVIVVSHDRYFLDRIAEKIFAFENNGNIQQYTGNYSDYIIRRDQKNNILIKQNSNLHSNDKKKTLNHDELEPLPTSTKPLKFTYKEQKEFEQIDTVISKLEEELSTIILQSDQVAHDYEKLLILTTKQEELENKLEFAINRWTYLNEFAEQIEKQNLKQ